MFLMRVSENGGYSFWGSLSGDSVPDSPGPFEGSHAGDRVRNDHGRDKQVLAGREQRAARLSMTGSDALRVRKAF